MQIINERVLKLLAEGYRLKLDLGSGRMPQPGYFGVDLPSSGCTDIWADLNEALDKIPNRCVDRIYTRHTLEHVENILLVMEEIHRIVAKDAVIDIIVPHFSNVYGYSDVTHRRLFGVYSMFYFSNVEHQPQRKVPSYYSNARFQVLSVRIRFYRHGILDFLISPVLERLINGSFQCQVFYERRLARLFHAWEIHYRLTPVIDITR